MIAIVRVEEGLGDVELSTQTLMLRDICVAGVGVLLCHCVLQQSIFKEYLHPLQDVGED